MTWCVEMKKIQNQCKKSGVIFFLKMNFYGLLLNGLCILSKKENRESQKKREASARRET
jgi:hypothetical protein